VDALDRGLGFAAKWRLRTLQTTLAAIGVATTAEIREDPVTGAQVVVLASDGVLPAAVAIDANGSSLGWSPKGELRSLIRSGGIPPNAPFAAIAAARSQLLALASASSRGYAIRSPMRASIATVSAGSTGGSRPTA
jgi:hypothetical protein